MFGLSFNQEHVTDAVVGFAFGFRLPTMLRVPLLGRDDLVHHVLPGSCDRLRIGSLQINAGHPQVERRQMHRFVFGVQQPFGLHRIFGLQAPLFASGVVNPVEHAPRAAEQPIPLLHFNPHKL